MSQPPDSGTENQPPADEPDEQPESEPDEPPASDPASDPDRDPASPPYDPLKSQPDELLGPAVLFEPPATGPAVAVPDDLAPEFIEQVTDKEEIPLHKRSDLILSRFHHYRDTIRSYQVLIDGQVVGRIKEEKTETFTLRPGSYEVRLRLLWIFSPRVQVELPPGGEVHMICGPNGGILKAWRLFFAPTTAIVLRHDPQASTSV